MNAVSGLSSTVVLLRSSGLLSQPQPRAQLRRSPADTGAPTTRSAARGCRQHAPEIKARSAHANSGALLLLPSQQAAEKE